MPTLFEIADALRSLERIADTDDIPPEVLRDTLESLEGDFEVKAVAIAKFILSLQSTADSIADAADRMKLRGVRMQNRAESIKAYLLWTMQAVDRKRIETDELIIRRQNNPPSVMVTNEAAVPAEYWVQPPPPAKHIDKKAVKKALEAGAVIDGAFIEQGEHVRISL